MLFRFCFFFSFSGYKGVPEETMNSLTVKHKRHTREVDIDNTERDTWTLVF